ALPIYRAPARQPGPRSQAGDYGQERRLPLRYRMTPSFGKRLTASNLFVVAVTLVFTGWLLTPRLKQAFLSQLEQSLAVQTTLIAQDAGALLRAGTPPAAAQNQVLEFARLTGCRVTLIRADGVVIGDSERSLEDIPKMA